MSTTLLYHVYNTRGYRYRGTKYVPGGVEFTVEQPRDRCCCPARGAENVILKGAKTRRFHAPPMGRRLGGSQVAVEFQGASQTFGFGFLRIEMLASFWQEPANPLE